MKRLLFAADGRGRFLSPRRSTLAIPLGKVTV